MTRIIIKGSVPSKKNGKEICTRGDRKFLISSKAYREWNECAVLQIRGQTRGKKFDACKMILTFYYGNHHRHDTDNGVSSVFDTLKDAGTVEDDNSNIIKRYYVPDAQYDKLNPRVEIEIYEPDEPLIINF